MIPDADRGISDARLQRSNEMRMAFKANNAIGPICEDDVARSESQR